MRTKIRLHKGQAGRLLNLTPKILLIPAALETVTQQYLSQNYLYGVMKAQAEQNVNPFAGAFQVIVEPRLDAHSPTTWYGIVDPGMIDTAEIAFLDGQSGPYLDSRQGFEVSGMEWRDLVVVRGQKYRVFLVTVNNQGGEAAISLKRI